MRSGRVSCASRAFFSASSRRKRNSSSSGTLLKRACSESVFLRERVFEYEKSTVLRSSYLFFLPKEPNLPADAFKPDSALLLVSVLESDPAESSFVKNCDFAASELFESAIDDTTERDPEPLEDEGITGS